MTILFTSTTLSPDLSQLAAWLVTEGLAWFQGASPVQLAVGVWTASLGLSAAVVWAMRRWG